MHVFEAALVANTTGTAATSRSQPIDPVSSPPARLLRRALAGFVVLGMAVALLDAAAPAQSPMLAGTSMTAR